MRNPLNYGLSPSAERDLLFGVYRKQKIICSFVIEKNNEAMLVPAMNLAELKKEVLSDYPVVQRKSEYVLKKMKKLYHPIGAKNYLRIFDYYSPQKNHWLYKLEFTKKMDDVSHMTYYFGNKGLTAIVPLTDGYMLYITSHFLKRFDERMNLQHSKPEDIMRTYLLTQGAYQMKTLTEQPKPGLSKIYTVMPTGVALGTIVHNLKFIKFNTFLPDEMLNHKQSLIRDETVHQFDHDHVYEKKIMVDLINRSLEKYIHEAHLID